MRYITDILTRYQGGYGFVAGAAQATIEGYINKGIFMAGIAYNERNYLRKASDKSYEIPLYRNAEFIFSDLTLEYNEQILVFGFASLAAESDGIFAPPPMVSFVRAKNLGITEIDEGNGGEIVENFGTKSWDIDIKGLLIEMDEHHYPQQKVRQLARFFEINDIVSVTSPIFQDLGIDSIYFSEHRMEPLEGFPDTVRFELKAKSAMPAEFSILNDKTLQLA